MKTTILSFFNCTCSILLLAQCDVEQASIDNYVYSNTQMAQSFVACTTSEISHIDGHVHGFLQSETDAVFHLLSGDGLEGDTLYSQNIILNGDWGGFTDVVVENGPVLQAGQSYTLLYEFIEDYGACWVDLSNVYDDGRFYWSGEMMEDMELGFTVHMQGEVASCIEWTGAENERWSQAENWSLGRVPNEDDCVILGPTPEGPVMIDEVAMAGSLTVEEGAALQLTDEGILHISTTLNAEGQTDLQGTLIMENVDGQGGIVGELTARRLKVIDEMMLWEPLTILDLLDLSEGRLINIGTHLTIEEGPAFKGHIYYPDDAMIGTVLLKRHDRAEGIDIISAPVGPISLQALQDSLHSTQGLMEFNGASEFSDFHQQWVPLTGQDDRHDVLSCYRSVGTAEEVMVSGEVRSTDETIQGISGAEWQAVANPYASIIDWEKVEKSVGGHAALYQWDEENAQFSCHIDGLSTHGADSRIAPMEGFFVRLSAGERLGLDYSKAAIRPRDLYGHGLPSDEDRTFVAMEVSTSRGTDETIVSIGHERSGLALPSEDGWKIPSMVDEVPTLGSISADRHILSINQTNITEEMDGIPLYVDGGGENEIVLRASLIDFVDGSRSLFLEDRDRTVFHDLFTQGDYVTTMSPSRTTGRFYLHFTAPIPDHADPTHLPTSDGDPSDADDDTGDPTHLPAISAVGDEIYIIPPIAMFPQEGEGGGPSARLTEIRVFDMGGRLVYDNSVNLSGQRSKLRIPVRSGCYLVHLTTASGRVSQKVFIDPSIGH